MNERRVTCVGSGRVTTDRTQIGAYMVGRCDGCGHVVECTVRFGFAFVHYLTDVLTLF